MFTVRVSTRPWVSFLPMPLVSALCAMTPSSHSFAPPLPSDFPCNIYYGTANSSGMLHSMAFGGEKKPYVPYYFYAWSIWGDPAPRNASTSPNDVTSSLPTWPLYFSSMGDGYPCQDSSKSASMIETARYTDMDTYSVTQVPLSRCPLPTSFACLYFTSTLMPPHALDHLRTAANASPQ